MKNINYIYVKRIYSIIYILRIIATAALMIFYMILLLAIIPSVIFFAFDLEAGKGTAAMFSCLMLYIGFLIKWIGIIKVPFHCFFPISILVFCIIICP